MSRPDDWPTTCRLCRDPIESGRKTKTCGGCLSTASEKIKAKRDAGVKAPVRYIGPYRCPTCGNDKDQRVVETRTRPNGAIKRRRKCPCGKRWNTLETRMTTR